MSQPLAIVPKVQEVLRPDISWIRKNVPILAVARALGLSIRYRKTQCWRVENHRHGDKNPSLSFSEKHNCCKCFVCDVKRSHSNIDLVMHVLGFELGAAVQWIAERFPVPSVKVGRPVGSAIVAPLPYRVGVHGSECWEVIVRSGMWGAMTAAESRILFTLDQHKDVESGLTRMSYRAIMRYSGVAKPGNVADAIKSLCRMGALQLHRGQRIGVTRECSAYRVTLDNPKFRELCNAVFADARQEIAREREYRASQKRDRERAARKPNGPSLQVVTQNTAEAGGLRPPIPPVVCASNSNSREQKETRTSKSLNLSSPGEVHVNFTLPRGKREISVSEVAALAKLQRDKEILRERGYLP